MFCNGGAEQLGWELRGVSEMSSIDLQRETHFGELKVHVV